MPEEQTEVEGLVITGQRRKGPGYIWPSHNYPLAEGPLGEAAEFEPGEMGSICEDPQLREEWDKDAAAAKAKQAMEEAAAADGEQLGHRERTAVLYRKPDGTIAVGSLGEGLTATGAAQYDFTGIDMGSVVGIIHNHPGGSQRPSPADWAVFDALKTAIGPAGALGLRAYVVAPTYTPPSANPEWKIFIYDDRNRTGGETGPEVNPDGQPC